MLDPVVNYVNLFLFGNVNDVLIFCGFVTYSFERISGANILTAAFTRPTALLIDFGEYFSISLLIAL